MTHTIKSVVLNTVNQKLCDVIDDFCTNEFVEMVGDKIYKETGDTLSFDEIKEILSTYINPLLIKMGEWTIEQK